MKKLNVLIIGATMAPLVKVGGLADVMESLPIALKKVKVHVTSLIPYYDAIKTLPGMKPKGTQRLVVTFNGKAHTITIHRYSQGTGKADLHLMEDSHFFKGKTIYPVGYVSGTRIKNENRRFTFFSLAATAYVATLKTTPDVVHVHDWHSALIPYLIRRMMTNAPKTLFTIHNLAFQGTFPKRNVERLLRVSLPGKSNTINFMKLGIEYADHINTVSPTYAKEILTKSFGFGLEGSLAKRKGDLYGILNGINLDRFNPEKDSNIYKTYSKKTASKGKEINKDKLLKSFKLKNNDGPVFGMVSRIFEQKGFPILNPAIPNIVKKGGVVIVLGSGIAKFENELKKLAKKYPENIGVRIGFDAALAQQIYAGSDFFLMPSKFEPCGLGQMIAMRYGTLPLVRATGGLKDTVKGSGVKANGIVFKSYTKAGITKAFNDALKVYKQKVVYTKRRNQAFSTDFSWDASAKEYIKLYRK